MAAPEANERDFVAQLQPRVAAATLTVHCASALAQALALASTAAWEADLAWDEVRTTALLVGAGVVAAHLLVCCLLAILRRANEERPERAQARCATRRDYMASCSIRCWT